MGALVGWLRARGFPAIGPAPAVLLGGYGDRAELLPCGFGRGPVGRVQVYGFTDADVPAE